MAEKEPFDTSVISMNGKIISFDEAYSFIGKTVGELVSFFDDKYYADKAVDAPGATLYFNNCPYAFTYSAPDGNGQAIYPFTADDVVTGLSLWSNDYEFYNGIKLGESKESVSAKVGDVDNCYINENDYLDLYFDAYGNLTWCRLHHYVY